MEKTRFGLADGLVQRKKQAMGCVGIRYSALLILGLKRPSPPIATGSVLHQGDGDYEPSISKMLLSLCYAQFWKNSSKEISTCAGQTLSSPPTRVPIKSPSRPLGRAAPDCAECPYLPPEDLRARLPGRHRGLPSLPCNAALFVPSSFLSAS